MGRPTADYTPLPRTASNRVDKALIHRMYLASKFVEWLPFCQENNWSPKLARIWCPTAKWIAEKRELVEQAMAAELRQLQIDHRQSWIKDVRATLQEYPKAVDNVMYLVQKWMAVEMKRVAQDPEKQSSPNRLYAVAETVKKCIEAKKSILLISDAVVAMRPPDPEAPKDGDEAQWNMEIRGMKNPTVKEVQELLHKYVDKPMVKTAPTDEPTHESTHEPTDDVSEDADAEA